MARWMILGLLTTLTLFGAAMAAVTWDTQQATDLVLNAEAQPEGERASVALRAVALVDAAPLQASAWHAGLMEVQAWALATATQDVWRKDPANAANLAQASVAATEKTLALAPSQPAAWVRLGAMPFYGARSTLCSAASCLERSMMAAPLTMRRELACARLYLGIQTGYFRHPDDLALRMTLGTIPLDVAAGCMTGAEPKFLYEALIRAPRL
jgi:hypothetical protein